MDEASQEQEQEQEPAPVPDAAQLYETPVEYTAALVRCIKDMDVVFDPSAGNGAIFDVFRENGYETLGRELHTMSPTVDFLKDEPPPAGDFDIVVMNPPFQQTLPFLRRAIALEVPFAQLMLLTQLSSVGVKQAIDAADISPDILLIPRVSPFKHKGRTVNLPPCVWLVHHPEHSSKYFEYADRR